MKYKTQNCTFTALPHLNLPSQDQGPQLTPKGLRATGLRGLRLLLESNPTQTRGSQWFQGLWVHSLVTWSEQEGTAQDKLWQWHFSKPASRRRHTFAGETFDVEMFGLNPKHFTLARLPAFMAVNDRLLRRVVRVLGMGHCKKNKRAMRVEGIPTKAICGALCKGTCNFGIKRATYWSSKWELCPFSPMP